MEKSRISKLIGLIQKASFDLGIKPEDSWVEQCALSVFSAMDHPNRVFHQLEHAFDLASNLRGASLFAALYHDVVYYQVDGHLPRKFEDMVMKTVSYGPSGGDGYDWQIRDEKRQSRYSKVALQLFGFSPLMKLKQGFGVNEFLSALCALEQLSGVLSDKDLLEVVACIEASIPFRATADNKESCFDRLYKNVFAASRLLGVSLTKKECEKIVKESVAFANVDVDNFARVDTGSFLVETWKLYLEMNPALRQANSFYFASYRSSLVSGLNFFLTLESEKVFRSYRNFPSENEITKKTARVNINLDIAVRYIETKLLTIGIMEAISDLTGGDAPISMLLGESGDKGVKEHIEDYLENPRFTIDKNKVKSSAVYRLLALGKKEGGFELAPSPLSTYLYDCLGENEVLELCDVARSYFAGRMSSFEFLLMIDQKMLASVILACAHICTTRSKKLMELASKMAHSKKAC